MKPIKEHKMIIFLALQPRAQSLWEIAQKNNLLKVNQLMYLQLYN